jgi:hypothetical protein
LFTQEELDELHEKSAEHVDALKNDVYHKLEEEFTIDKILRRTVKSKKRKVEVPGSLRKDGTRRETTFKTVVEEEEFMTPMEPKEVHQAARMFALEHYVGLNKMPPPNFQKLVVWHMIRICKKVACEHVQYIKYFASKI